MESQQQPLHVSMQTDNLNVSHRSESKISQTLDYQNSVGEVKENNDEKVKKFRELYFKNQLLRKDLKALNSKLNEKLEKIKLPNVKRRAISVDLNREPASKTLNKQLSSAYSQMKKYKSRIQFLKVREETPQNYAKLKDMENLIAFRDQQIESIKEQLKSVINIKKLQQKKISYELENDDIKTRLELYEKEYKELKDRLKVIVKNGRKTQEQYKKQQAHLVNINKKLRIITNSNQSETALYCQKIETTNIQREISQKQFQQVKQQIITQKKVNDEILKKTEILRKSIQNSKTRFAQDLQKYKEKEVVCKKLQMTIVALNRLIREEEKKQKSKQNQELQNEIKQSSINMSLYEDIISKQISISQEDLSMKKMLNEFQSKQRQWKGKFRKVEFGFGGPTDKKFQLSKQITGFQVSLDQNEAICGIMFISKGESKQQAILGKRSKVQMKWQLQPNDQITQISGSFTSQSYLSEFSIQSKHQSGATFGSVSSEKFAFKFNEQEQISGSFGSVREFGKDCRITQLGLWIQKI